MNDGIVTESGAVRFQRLLEDLLAGLTPRPFWGNLQRYEEHYEAKVPED